MSENIKREKMYYDVKTKNKSFLKLSKMLKDEGVKHYMFILGTYDPLLVGVDPWSAEVQNNPEMKMRVSIECEKNIWYFLREVVRVPVAGGNVMFSIHKGNLAMIFSMIHNFKTAIELPRQHYKTYSAVYFYLWVILFKSVNYSMIFTHKSYTDTTENLKKLKVLLEHSSNCLPSYIIPSVNEKDKNNEALLTLGAKNNTIRCVSPSNSEEGADKAGIEWKIITFARYKLF